MNELEQNGILEPELNDDDVIETEIEGIETIMVDDYEDLKNKPLINGVELNGNKSLSDLGIDQDFVKDNNYVHTDNNYTTEEKTKLSTLENYDDTEVKADISSLKATETTQNNEISNIKLNYTLKTENGSVVELNINSETYVMTLKLKNSEGTILSTDNIDLPLETMVVGASYDSATKEIVLTLKSGSTTRFSVADLVSGLQSEITSTNKLDSSLIDDSLSNNKFVTPTEKTTWNNKQDILTFDNTPTQNSTNPVTSNGIYEAIQNAGGGDDSNIAYLGDVSSYNSSATALNLNDLEAGKLYFLYGVITRFSYFYVTTTVGGVKQTKSMTSSTFLKGGTYFITLKMLNNVPTESTSFLNICLIRQLSYTEDFKQLQDNVWSASISGTTLSVSNIGNTAMINLNNCVNLIDGQSISGKKTFTTLPESSVVPSTNNQLVNKKYVDDAIASITDADNTSY